METDMDKTTRGGPQPLLNLHDLLSERLRITTTQSRVFLGHFLCTDNALNIILGGAEEVTTTNANSPDTSSTDKDLPSAFPFTPQSSHSQQTKFMGLIVIPGSRIQKIECLTQVLRPPSSSSSQERFINRHGNAGDVDWDSNDESNTSESLFHYQNYHANMSNAMSGLSLGDSNT